MEQIFHEDRIARHPEAEYPIDDRQEQIGRVGLRRRRPLGIGERRTHHADQVEHADNRHQAGVFEELFSNQDGCDSLVITTIDLLPSDTTEVFDSTCDPFQVGVFEELFSNQDGCDSLVITTITTAS